MSKHCVWSGAEVKVGPAGWLGCPGCRARWRKPPSSWARVPTHRRCETDGDGKKPQSLPRIDGDAVSQPPTTPCPSEGTPALESISGARSQTAGYLAVIRDQGSGSQARQREPDLFDVLNKAAEELARDGVTISLDELKRNLAAYEEPDR